MIFLLYSASYVEVECDMYEIGEKTETILSSLQACLVIAHSEDFVKNIHNHHLYTLQTCMRAWQKILMLCVCGGMTTFITFTE